MNLPTITPENLERLQAVNFPMSFNWGTRALAGLRESLMLNQKMYATLMNLIDERCYEVTLRSTINPAWSVTMPAHLIEGDCAEPLISALSNRGDMLGREILHHIYLMQDPTGDHQEDLNCPTTKDRLEVLRLLLTPEEYAAITAPAPMCEPAPRTIPLPPAAASIAEKAA